MINRNAPKPALPRPKKCAKCGGAISWKTAIMCGEEVGETRDGRNR